MTRFARAKGSKASNERIPEEATTWQEMKKQLESKQKEKEDNKKRKEVEQKRQENYEKFLESVKTEKTSNTLWSEFPQQTKLPDRPKSAKREKFSSKNTVKKDLREERMDIEDDDAPEEVGSKIPVPATEIKRKKKKVPANKPLVISKVKEESAGVTNKGTTEPKKKDWSHLSQEEINRRMDKKREKRQKRSAKMKEKKKLVAEANGQSVKKFTALKRKEKKTLTPETNGQSEEQVTPSKKQGKNNVRTENSEQSTKETSFSKKTKANGLTSPKVKLTRNDKMEKQVEFKRRKPESDASEVMFINGEKVELVKFLGFPIRKEDADRLHDLRKKMISKGIPRSEINVTLKLERRKCEKAITRMKKHLCFNCRKSGHNLSECPQLENKQTIASGICFKCRSTEHTHFECKVVRATEFKFAECFICKEQGHIARQCPENPRGLYPKGGACKLCGDVTHFKKDCPTLQLENGEGNNAFCVGVLNDSNGLESLGDESRKSSATMKEHKIKKIMF